MGRTLPSITNAFLHEQQSLARFRRALRRTDQRALDDLFGASRHHLAAAAYASHLLPFEIMLLSMLVEEHKMVLHLQVELERLHILLGLEGTATPSETADEALPVLPSGTLSAVHSGMPPPGCEARRSAIPPASLEVHEPSPPPYDPEATPPPPLERKRKWWAGG
jgi:uncharacterized protein YjiS (DUF1127 family)